MRVNSPEVEDIERNSSFMNFSCSDLYLISLPPLHDRQFFLGFPPTAIMEMEFVA